MGGVRDGLKVILLVTGVEVFWLGGFGKIGTKKEGIKGICIGTLTDGTGEGTNLGTWIFTITGALEGMTVIVNGFRVL